MTFAPSEDSDQPGHPDAQADLGHPDAQADLSLHWEHGPFCWFCYEVVQIAVIILKFNHRRLLQPNDADRMANNADPDQIALGLHCLPRPVCLKT